MSSDTNYGDTSDAARELFQMRDDRTLLYDPRQRDYTEVRDRSKEIAELSKKFQPAAKEKKLFIKRRAELQNQRNLRLASKARASLEKDEPPIPGGWGNGVFFKEMELLFAQTSANYNYIIAPAALGGINDDYFYLTATNRAGWGCEAFVSYFSQEKPLFRVFDWAKYFTGQVPWVVSIPYDEWGGYKLPYNISGEEHFALYITNATYRLGDDNWRNEVYLHNDATDTKDRVWSYDFHWAPQNDDERNGHWWGPILETFASDYGETNTVGFAEALLVQDGSEHMLVDANSSMENDGSDHGFQVFNLVPNNTYFAR
jgi:hypothetical protein